MKVLHIESGRHLYGGARQVGYLIDGLARAGVDNVLVCPPGQPLAQSALPAAVVALPMRGDLDLGLGRRLSAVIAAEAPDIVHVHSRRGADWFGGRASRRAGRPAVLTRRVEAPETGPLARLRYRPYQAVVAISRVVAAALERDAGLPAGRLRLIPSAVDAARFRPDPRARERLLAGFALDADSLIAGVAAQLIPRKGHDFLLELWPELKARRPELELLLFGRGREEARLRRRVGALGLDGSVHFAGFRPDIERLLPGLDLLLHPATREGLGAVLLEAMSAGLPIVAANAGGIGDAIRPGVDGLLLPPHDRGAWLEALDALCGDAALRARLGTAARARSGRDFTIERMTASYRALYDDVLR